MKVIAVNGSPRKNWNTATLLQKALEGAKSVGAQAFKLDRRRSYDS
ncbi:NADPH-dependent FMN reductase [Desulfosporosinus sp. OT]|nr:NADPH-dependent FMN reductase [Desulfosporosinus sp. OT]